MTKTPQKISTAGMAKTGMARRNPRRTCEALPAVESRHIAHCALTTCGWYKHANKMRQGRDNLEVVLRNRIVFRLSPYLVDAFY
jgi:hypothetical protein